MRRLLSSRAAAWLAPVLLTACNAILGNEPRILDVDSASPVPNASGEDATVGQEDAPLDSAPGATPSDTGAGAEQGPDAIASAEDARSSADATTTPDAQPAADVVATPPQDATADGSAPPQACPNGNGPYCGGDGIGGDPSTLYFCTAGMLRAMSPAPCPHGCHVVHAALDDYCEVDCNGMVNGGFYCGSEIGGSTDILYRCTGGASGTIMSYCPNGCSVQPMGTNDRCN